MKWKEVRELYPNQFAKFEILESGGVCNMNKLQYKKSSIIYFHSTLPFIKWKRQIACS